MADFRETLYEKYFETQSGRRLSSSLKQRLLEGHAQLKKEILPLLPKEKTPQVLDIGCGFGEFLLFLKSQGYSNIQGIDISPDQIAQAKELGLENVRVADVFDFLASHKNQFDVITGIDIIEHFDKNELLRLLKLVKEALKPGGTSVFRTPNMDAPFTSTFAFGDYTHQSFLNYSSAQQIFTAAGFEAVEVLPSFIQVRPALKEFIRKIFWGLLTMESRLILFASGKSAKGVYFTPNLLIKVRR